MDDTQKSKSEQIDFFNKCYETYVKASGKTGERKLYYSIGGSTVCLSFAGQELISLLTPALQHLQIEQPNVVNLTLCVWDSTSTKTEMVPPPCGNGCFTDRGDIWGFHSDRIKTAFHWVEFSVNVLDLEANVGVFWVQNPEFLPFWVFASPLRTLFHWWMEKKGHQLLHAAAVGTGAGAVLIPGKGGSGKSTTALSCLDLGFFYLADDYVIVQLKPDPAVYSLYCTAKLNPDQLVNFPQFEEYVGNHEKLVQEKAIMFLHPEFTGQIVTKMELKSVLLPIITPAQVDTEVAPVSNWKIRRAMSFTTISQLPSSGYHTHKFINKVTDTVPCHALELGTSIEQIAPSIERFLQSPQSLSNPQRSRQESFDRDASWPLVSVIIPVFNGENFVEEAISNVFSQNYPAIEIIVVDDGSTDRTKETIERFGKDIRYFHQENSGPASARNRAIKEASGEFFAFLDVDDLWPENNLRILVDELTKNLELQVVRGYAQLIVVSEKTGNFEYVGNPNDVFEDYIGAALYRKSVFKQVGLFNQLLNCGEDTDWFRKAVSLSTPIKRIEEITLHVRRHGGNMTLNEDFVEKNKLHKLKRAIDAYRNLQLEHKKPPQ